MRERERMCNLLQPQAAAVPSQAAVAAANVLTSCMCFTCPLTRLLNKKCIVTTASTCHGGTWHFNCFGDMQRLVEKGTYQPAGGIGKGCFRQNARV